MSNLRTAAGEEPPLAAVGEEPPLAAAGEEPPLAAAGEEPLLAATGESLPAATKTQPRQKQILKNFNEKHGISGSYY